MSLTLSVFHSLEEVTRESSIIIIHANGVSFRLPSNQSYSNCFGTLRPLTRFFDSE